VPARWPQSNRVGVRLDGDRVSPNVFKANGKLITTSFAAVRAADDLLNSTSAPREILDATDGGQSRYHRRR
jgi:hypothetical protein